MTILSLWLCYGSTMADLCFWWGCAVALLYICYGPAVLFLRLSCGSAVALLWICCGQAVLLLWLCCGFAVALLWFCHGTAILVLCLCYGSAMSQLSFCCGSVMVLLWLSYLCAVALLWHGCGSAVAQLSFCCEFVLLRMISKHGPWMHLGYEPLAQTKSLFSRSSLRVGNGDSSDLSEYFPISQHIKCSALKFERIPVPYESEITENSLCELIDLAENIMPTFPLWQAAGQMQHIILLATGKYEVLTRMLCDTSKYNRCYQNT